MECVLAVLVLVWIVVVSFWKVERRGLIGMLALAAVLAIATWVMFGTGG